MDKIVFVVNFLTTENQNAKYFLLGIIFFKKTSNRGLNVGKRDQRLHYQHLVLQKTFSGKGF